MKIVNRKTLKRVMPLGIVASLFIFTSLVEAAELNSFLKSWKAETGRGNFKIQFYQKGDKIFGDATPLQGDQNKIRKEFIKDLVYQNGKLEDGKIYLKRLGRYANISFELMAEKKLKAEIKVLGRSRTKIWESYP